jgi:hypothetical protein
MKKTVTESMFHAAFKDMDREDNFSYDARAALFEYLEQYEEDTGEMLELDVIALCCEYTEYENIAEYNEAYGTDYTDRDEVGSDTVMIPVGDEGFIAQNH